MGEVRTDLRVSFIYWEVLRLAFNAILLVENLAYGSGQLERLAAHWPNALLFALIANALFSVGPLTDCYLRVFRGRGSGRVRLGLRTIWFTLVLSAFVWISHDAWAPYQVP